MRRLFVLLCPLALSACGDDAPPICKAIDANRAAYIAAEKEANGMARDAAREKAVVEGRKRLAAAIGSGAITDWKVEVKSVASDLKGLPVVKLSLPCEGTLIAGDVAPGSDLAQQVGSLKVGKSATMSGQFVKALDGSSPFMEISITDRGRMTGPEFIVRLTSIKQ